MDHVEVRIGTSAFIAAQVHLVGRPLVPVECTVVPLDLAPTVVTTNTGGVRLAHLGVVDGEVVEGADSPSTRSPRRAGRVLRRRRRSRTRSGPQRFRTPSCKRKSKPITGRGYREDGEAPTSLAAPAVESWAREHPRHRPLERVAVELAQPEPGEPAELASSVSSKALAGDSHLQRVQSCSWIVELVNANDQVNSLTGYFEGLAVSFYIRPSSR